MHYIERISFNNRLARLSSLYVELGTTGESMLSRFTNYLQSHAPHFPFQVIQMEKAIEFRLLGILFRAQLEMITVPESNRGQIAFYEITSDLNDRKDATLAVTIVYDTVGNILNEHYRNADSQFSFFLQDLVAYIGTVRRDETSRTIRLLNHPF